MKLSRLLTGLAALLVLDLVLIQPNHPGAMTLDALRLFPLELPVVILTAVLIRREAPGQWLFRATVVIWLLLLVIMKLADFAMFTALGRYFNLFLDLHLVAAGWDLVRASFGILITLGMSLAVLVVLGVLLALLWWAIGVWLRTEPAAAFRPWVFAAWVCATLWWVSDLGHALRVWQFPVTVPGSSFSSRVTVEQVERLHRTQAELARFRTLTASDPLMAGHDIFDVLADTDVLIVYVESYGRSSLEHPLYAPTHRATLRDAESKLTAAGYAMRSGWLTAPTAGGQSWLSHATLANGLWVADQIRYRALLTSGRQSLFHLAQQAGFRTAAVMPAITLPWPESDSMGFDTVFEARDMGYLGQAFNWITMPDQYTLHVLHERLRSRRDSPSQPLFAQIALISSHAPWVPVPELVPWRTVAEPEVFDQWAESGDSPQVVWRDRDRVRDQFRQAIDYSLAAVMAYAMYTRGDMPLMLVLGDHPPAPFVSQIDGTDTPVHVIGPPELVARLDHLDWAPSLLPDALTPALPMNDWRDLFVKGYTESMPADLPKTTVK